MEQRRLEGTFDKVKEKEEEMEDEHQCITV